MKFCKPDSVAVFIGVKKMQNRQLIKSNDLSLFSGSELSSEETMSPEQLQALENYFKDNTISEEYYKITNIIKNSDISLEVKQNLISDFNVNYKDKYKLEVLIFTRDNENKFFNAKLICAKTDLIIASIGSSFFSYKKTIEMKQNFFPPPAQEKTKNTNGCKFPLLYASIAVGVAALTYFRLGV